jgi:hypothetical protein
METSSLKQIVFGRDPGRMKSILFRAAIKFGGNYIKHVGQRVINGYGFRKYCERR